MEPKKALSTRLANAARFIFETGKLASRDGIIGRAAEVAFYILLALPPTFLAIVGGTGYVAGLLGEATVDRIRDRVFDFAGIFFTSGTVNEFLRPAIDSLLGGGRADIVGLGLIIALWSASRATKVLMEAVRHFYKRDETRGPVRRRLVAFGVTMMGVMASVLVLPMLVAGPNIGAAIGGPFGLADAFRRTYQILYWPFVALAGVGLLTTFFHLALPGKTPWRHDFPGAVTTIGLWLLAGAGLRFYAATFIQTDSPYRALSAPVVLLLWLHVTALAILIGAEVNSQAEQRWG